jgi:NTP pyrophosphatase (non-canonical NTP hydrolase)
MPNVKVTYANKDSASIDSYFEDVKVLWEKDDTERTVFDLFLRLVDHSSRLAEAIRRERPNDVLDALSETMMWHLSLIGQLHRSLNVIDEPFRIIRKPSDIIWNKYPDLCPACLENFVINILRDLSKNNLHKGNIHKLLQTNLHTIQLRIKELAGSGLSSKLCTCPTRAKEAEERHALYAPISEDLNDLRIIYADLTRNRKIDNINELAEMFENIFFNVYQVYSIEKIAFHLLEEVGELSKAIVSCYSFDRKNAPYTKDLYAIRIKHLEEELADVFSWIYAIFLKIKSVYYRDAQMFFQQTLDIEKMSINLKLNVVESLTMSNIIWLKYGRKYDGKKYILYENSLICYGCFNNPCSCERDLRINWTKAIQSKIDPNKSFHIYYHADFDGIVSATLLISYLTVKHNLEIRKIITHPVDFHLQKKWQDKNFHEPFAILDFLYHPKARYWLDHHHDPFVLPLYREDYERKSTMGRNIFWSKRNSTAIIVFENLIVSIKEGISKEDFDRLHDIMLWAEKIDSADYADVNEWFKSEAIALKLNLLILYHNSDEKLLDFIIKALVRNSINDLFKNKKIMNLYSEARKRMDYEYKQFARFAQLKGSVVFFDISEDKNFRYHRFFPYKVYKEAKFTVGIYRKGNAFEISIGKNPWHKPFESLNIGALCKAFNGGGHKDVGGITLDAQSIARKKSNVVIKTLNEYINHQE